jgi:hypothetical protein
MPWIISHYENGNFLILDNRVIGIKKTDDKYICKYIGFSDNSFEMIKRNPKWTKNQIYGTWIEEKYIDTDSSDFPPPPIEFEKYNWPPSYKISEKQIELDFYTNTNSAIEINNSLEFITMNLNHLLKIGVEKQWKIKTITDTLMIIERTKTIDHDFTTKT